MKLTTLLFGLLVSVAAHAASPKEIVIGTTVGDFGDMVKEFIKPELEKKGFSVKLVEFTDYVRPNLALSEGALSANVFQHKPYLETFAKEHQLQLSPLVEVPTAPLGLYAGKKKSLADIGTGSRIAVPNDPSNLARALVLASDLGWVKLKAGLDPLRVTVNDIETNLKKIQFVQLEAAQLPRAREDVDYAVINGNYAISSGIPFTSALAQEKQNAFVNWVVVRSNDLQNESSKALKEAYTSKGFQTYAKKRFAGYKFPKGF